MRGLVVAVGLLLGLSVTAEAQVAPTAGLREMGTAAEGYAQVRPETAIRFPEDHGPHPGFRIEWWYITANLRDAAGVPLGVQWTLFRFATRAGATGAETGWAAPQIWMGHAAVTTAETHHAAERLARGGVGQAGAAAAPFRAWIDDWRFESEDMAFSPLRLAAEGEGFSYELRLTADGPMVLQGEDGYSVKSERGQASHYASQPFFRVSGRVTIDGVLREVTGRAWMDREWSSQPLTEEQTGWDWLSLHLPDGDKLMVYRLRETSGQHYVTGNWIGADGSSERLAPGRISMTPTGRATVAEGREMDVRWRVEIPDKGIDIQTRPLNPRAWNALSTAYWEGPVSFEGSHSGEGYLEMTGG